MHRFAPRLTGEASTFALLMAPDIGDMPTAPALSATSDLPVPAAPPPDPAPPADPQDPPPDAGEGADDAQNGEAQNGETPPAAAEPEPLRRARQTAQDRIKEAVTARREAEARADRLTDSLEKAVDALSRAAPPQPATPATPVVPPTPRPSRDQFDDPDAYDTALVEWSSRAAAALASAEVDRKLAEQRTNDERTRAEADSRKQFETVQQSFQSRKTELIANPEFADFDEVALNPDLTVSEHMTPAILQAENGPDVLYHLGKHPEEAARIAALPPLRQVIEIGRLSARLEAPAAPPPRRLPPPIDPLNGNRNPADKTESDAEYYARRERELQNQRRASMWGRPSAPVQ